MTANATKRLAPLVRYESLDDMPPAPPLSDEFRAMSDEEVERRAASDPDAGELPAGFWDAATPTEPEHKEAITIRLDPDVLRFFRGLGKGYQSRMNAVLKSYVRAQKKAG